MLVTWITYLLFDEQKNSKFKSIAKTPKLDSSKLVQRFGTR